MWALDEVLRPSLLLHLLLVALPVPVGPGGGQRQVHRAGRSGALTHALAGGAAVHWQTKRQWRISKIPLLAANSSSSLSIISSYREGIKRKCMVDIL